MRLAEAQFLGDTCDAERLAGKAGAKNVMRGNVRHRHGMNIAVRRLVEIGGVGLLRVFVPVGGEDAFAPGTLEREAKTADATEQIYELGFVMSAISVHTVGNRLLAELVIFNWAFFGAVIHRQAKFADIFH